MSFDSDANHSNANALNKNEYNFAHYVQDSMLTSEINVKFTDSAHQIFEGVINFLSDLIE